MCVWDGVWLAWTGGKGILGLSSDLWAEKASCMLEEPCLQTFPVLASQVLEWVPFPPIPLLWAKVESPSGFLAEQPSEMAGHILTECGSGHQHGNSWLTLHVQQAANVWGWHVPFLPSCCLFSIPYIQAELFIVGLFPGKQIRLSSVRFLKLLPTPSGGWHFSV